MPFYCIMKEPDAYLFRLSCWFFFLCIFLNNLMNRYLLCIFSIVITIIIIIIRKCDCMLCQQMLKKVTRRCETNQTVDLRDYFIISSSRSSSMSRSISCCSCCRSKSAVQVVPVVFVVLILLLLLLYYYYYYNDY